jgi:hypothetical protein
MPSKTFIVRAHARTIHTRPVTFVCAKWNGTKLSILVKAARERGAGGGGECILKFLPTLPVLSASFSLLVKLPAPGASTTKKTLIFVTFVPSVII